MYKKIAVIFMILFFSFNIVLASQTIKIVTEEYPPHNYMENGKVVGLSTEIIERVCKELKMNYTIEIVPWARAVAIAKSEPNAIIYTICRLPDRETQYKWVRPVTVFKFYFFSLKDRHLDINDLDTAKKMSIGTYRKDATETFLLTKGFELNKNLFSAADTVDMVQTLYNRRVDAIPIDDFSMAINTKKIGAPPNSFVKNMFLFQVDAYFAFSNQTSDATVKKFQQAFDKLQKKGDFDKIRDKYFKKFNITP